ncbi:2-keto-4-pentenoate hydratase [Brevundimonas basaltis]|nr:fumarylacetoacetate hydrolase family protein [Brevundimonas basaltis]
MVLAVSLAKPPASEEATQIAKDFVEARLQARSIGRYPGVPPETMAAAYNIQEAAIAQFPGTIAGWKVGGVPVALQERLGVHRVSGPIFDRGLWRSDDVTPVRVPAIAGGFAAVEAEFVARIGAVDPVRLDWTIEAAQAAIDAMFVGVEVAGSPLSELNDMGPAAVASDFGNHAGLVLGYEVPAWRERMSEVAVETRVNGVHVGAGGAASLAGGPLESVRFLLEHCARRGRPLTEGMLISTGAVTGVHRVGIGDVSVCRFGGIAELQCLVVEASPTES